MITLTTKYMLHEKLILKAITTGKSLKPIYYNFLSYYFGSTFDRILMKANTIIEFESIIFENNPSKEEEYLSSLIVPVY